MPITQQYERPDDLCNGCHFVIHSSSKDWYVCTVTNEVLHYHDGPFATRNIGIDQHRSNLIRDPHHYSATTLDGFERTLIEKALEIPEVARRLEEQTRVSERYG